MGENYSSQHSVADYSIPQVVHNKAGGEGEGEEEGYISGLGGKRGSK